MLQCGAKNVNPLERFVSSLPVAAVLPELLAALDGASQVLLSAPTGAGKSTWLPLQLLAHPGINGKIILVWRRVTLRNDWRSCLTKSQAIPLATGCVRKTASGRIPAWKWLPKAC